MTWRLARSIETLRNQVNAAWPGRATASDGTLGDPSHSSRESDHNPDAFGIVRAIDITHDPASGADMEKLAEALRESRDGRIAYIIWNRRICSSTTSPWAWRSYSGINPHTLHMHLSVVRDARADQTKAWAVRERTWFDMATEQELRKVVREELEKAINNLNREVNKELAETRKLLAVGKDQPYKPENINLKAILDK